MFLPSWNQAARKAVMSMQSGIGDEEEEEDVTHVGDFWGRCAAAARSAAAKTLPAGGQLDQPGSCGCSSSMLYSFRLAFLNFVLYATLGSAGGGQDWWAQRAVRRRRSPLAGGPLLARAPQQYALSLPLPVASILRTPVMLHCSAGLQPIRAHAATGPATPIWGDAYCPRQARTSWLAPFQLWPLGSRGVKGGQGR